MALRHVVKIARFPSLGNRLYSSATSALPADLDFCKALPKVELHAHAHGSIRDATIAAILKERRLHDTSLADVHHVPMNDRTIKECFELFGLLHRLIDNIPTMQRITREAIEDYASENVRYLELRSTPRALLRSPTPPVSMPATASPSYAPISPPSDDMGGPDDYIAAVLEVLAGAAADPSLAGRITTNYLVSINRGMSAEEADEVVSAALRATAGPHGRFIAGVDFSGNPTVNSFEQFIPALNRARAAGLPVTVHFGEVRCPQDNRAMLDWMPDRLGHALCLSDADVEEVIQKKIPVEVCPTSNLKTLSLQHHHHHPLLSTWLGASHPLCLCADDRGVFSTTLSDEVFHVASAYNLSRQQLAQLQLNSLDYGFHPHHPRRQQQQQHHLGPGNAHINASGASTAASAAAVPPPVGVIDDQQRQQHYSYEELRQSFTDALA